MRVLVCGDRKWKDWKYIEATLDIINIEKGIYVLIEGEAKGADSFARNWANSRGVKCEAYPAEWARYRHAAGPIRNKQMLTEGKPELVIAFHEDIENSKGTKNMVELAKAANVPVMVFEGYKDVK